MEAKRLGILLSGRGSNMRALVEATRQNRLPAQVALVVANVAEAEGLTWARDEGFPTVVLDQHDFKRREEHDQAVVQELEKHEVDLVCLAGYMRLLSPWFVKRFPGRILNIHPSLLPAFPGLDAQQLAIDHGVKLSGCTVHLVDEQLDHGPIIGQRAVPVLEGDTVESLSARILAQEHILYPAAVRLMCLGLVRVEGRRAHILDPTQADEEPPAGPEPA